jgi:hypothetical protein
VKQFSDAAADPAKRHVAPDCTIARTKGEMVWQLKNILLSLRWICYKHNQLL